MFASARAFTRAVNITAAPRSSVTTTTRAAAGDVWMPGSARPKYLDGSAPGYVSFVRLLCVFFLVCDSSGFDGGSVVRHGFLLHLDQSNRIESMMIHSFGDDDDDDGDDDGCSFGCASSPVRPCIRPSVYPTDETTKTRDPTRPDSGSVTKSKIRAR